MTPTFLDYETFYTDEYSLRKMSPVEYILDPRFEVIGCAVKHGLKDSPMWIEGPDLPTYFASLQPNRLWFVSHNALFDACITAWHYGVVPRLTTCTLNVSRALIGHVVPRLGLAHVARALELGEKGDVLPKTKGMGLAALRQNPTLYADFIKYAQGDADLCAGVFEKLVWSGQFPAEELAVMDMIIRMALQPQFVLNGNLLAEHLNDVVKQKEILLAQAMLMGAEGKNTLTRDLQFAELLKAHGVIPPMKTSMRTGRTGFAFAKSDTAFLDLQEHENPAVQVLVAARLGHKTTLEETRSRRFLNISQLKWPDGVQGRMPMPLRYAGAHTHRLSGDWSLNVQNLPRGKPSQPSKLRAAFEAPPGYKVVTVDAAQIEARLTAWLAKQEDLVCQFEKGEDVYANFASTVFQRPVNKTEHPTERFVGKQAILGLGFGLGWLNFQKRLKIDSKNQTGTAIELTDEEASNVVDLYRRAFPKVPSLWKHLSNNVIPIIAYGGYIEVGPCKVEKNKITLPALNGDGPGLCLFYDRLHRDNNDEWWFFYAGQRKKLYGGKLLENIIQALDRAIVIGAALRIQKRIAPYRLAQQAHDENAYVVKDEDVEIVKTVLLEEMHRRPVWAPDLPLVAEIGVGQSYGDAK